MTPNTIVTNDFTPRTAYLGLEGHDSPLSRYFAFLQRTKPGSSRITLKENTFPFKLGTLCGPCSQWLAIVGKTTSPRLSTTGEGAHSRTHSSEFAKWLLQKVGGSWMLEGKGLMTMFFYSSFFLVVLSRFLCSLPLCCTRNLVRKKRGLKDQRNLSARIFLLPVIKGEHRESTQISTKVYYYHSRLSPIKPPSWRNATRSATIDDDPLLESWELFSLSIKKMYGRLFDD
ncbi:hypothetical protein LZ30DRAFT_162649 [Colletotrichum cereale]|nr:hypothetical protein LZ30DRAFT_162649 [Colletotrichum cereale]